MNDRDHQLNSPEPQPLAADIQEETLDLQRIIARWESHAQPSLGDPTPSQADIQMTRAIVDIAAPLGISVHDHIIVGKNGHASLKGMRLI